MSITKDDFQKSMERLATMAKGTQLHHTGSDSDPGTWPGGAQQDLDEHGGDIHIDDNGTDYSGVRKALAAKVRKSLALTPAEVVIAEGGNPLTLIAGKVQKGQSLTSVESWAVKGGFDAKTGQYVKKGNDKPSDSADTPGEYTGASSVPPTNAGDDTTDEVESDAAKSFNQAVNTSLELQKGLELSPFLYELTRALGTALSGTEAGVAKGVAAALSPVVKRIEAIEKSIGDSFQDQGEFNKSLAGAVLGIGQVVSGNVQEATQQATQAAYAPKSQMRAGTSDGGVQVINKAVGPGGLEMDLTKSQISEAMVEMVTKGQLDTLSVIKFEGSGEINPQTRQNVLAYLSSLN